MRQIITRLGYFKWTIHNMIAHPLMELLHLIGLGRLGESLHLWTLPLDHDQDHEETDEKNG